MKYYLNICSKNVLKGPNLKVDTTHGTVTETDFRNWNQLLDANSGVAQEIVDNIFSGSLEGEKLGIDYTGFDNFIHYSSARERIDNFIYKLQRICKAIINTFHIFDSFYQ